MKRSRAPRRAPGRAVLAGLLWAALAGPLAGQQLLKNGDLEEKSPIFWDHPLYGQNVVVHGFSATDGLGGGCCLSLEGLVPRGQREWGQNVTEGFQAGGMVAAGVQVLAKALEGEAWLDLRASRAGLVVAGTSSARLKPGGPEGEWRRLTVLLRVPEGTTSVRLAVVLEGKGKLFLDDFLLVAGASLPAGPPPGTPAPENQGPENTTRPCARNRAAVYQVRASLELKATADSKGAQVLLALPAVDEGQCPFYFQIGSLPADGLREIRTRSQGGASTPPLLELKLQTLRTGAKISLDIETRLLLLPLSPPAEVPDSALAAPAWPAAARPHLPQTNLTRGAEAHWTKLLEGVEGPTGFWPWLSAALAAASSLDTPALALAGALRGRGLPARLLTGVVPAAGPTRPVLCVETWLPGPGWVRLLPTPPVLAPAPCELIAFRVHPPSAETRSSRFLPGHPEISFLEAPSSIQVVPRLDPAKGLFLECREVFALEEIQEMDLARLRHAVQANWTRWLAARNRGKGDVEAEFAGQAAAQTKDLAEMLRFLK